MLLMMMMPARSCSSSSSSSRGRGRQWRGCGLVKAWLMTVQFLLAQVLSEPTDDVSAAYRYLDNRVYTVPVLSKITPLPTRAELEQEFDRRFPPPPLFPPAPPSLKEDTNALVRKAIFHHLDLIVRGDPSANESDSTSNTPNALDHPNEREYNIHPCSLLDQEWAPKGPKVRETNPGVVLPGPPGMPGADGQRGSRGRRGKKGPVGPPGPIGPVGPSGIPGPRGTPGLPGYTGRPGAKGDAGSYGPRGFKGELGSRGHQGHPGPPGDSGTNGIPGLVIFPDATAMYGVALEGLVAYRSDVKTLYFRDHITWRPIRVTRCGDGIHDPDMGEECDDGNTDNNDACVGCRKAVCGDGRILRGTEECDGRDFDGKTCASLNTRMLGTLTCTNQCTISYRRCRYPRR